MQLCSAVGRSGWGVVWSSRCTENPPGQHIRGISLLLWAYEKGFVATWYCMSNRGRSLAMAGLVKHGGVEEARRHITSCCCSTWRASSSGKAALGGLSPLHSHRRSEEGRRGRHGRAQGCTPLASARGFPATVRWLHPSFLPRQRHRCRSQLDRLQRRPHTFCDNTTRAATVPALWKGCRNACSAQKSIDGTPCRLGAYKKPVVPGRKVVVCVPVVFPRPVQPCSRSSLSISARPVRKHGCFHHGPRSQRCC